MEEKKAGWGGKRPGAGRKPTGNVPKVLWGVKVTPEEKEFLIKALKAFRESKAEV